MSRPEEVGRMLDAEVAVKVMGATWRSFDRSFAGEPRMQLATFGGGDPADGTEENLGASIDVPAYSADVGAAFLVVRQMRAEGFHFDFGSRRSRPSDNAWFAKFWRDGMSRATPVTQDESPPLAICKAALLALTPDRAPTT